MYFYSYACFGIFGLFAARIRVQTRAGRMPATQTRTAMNTIAEPATFKIETALADPLEIDRYGDAVAAHARGEIPDDRVTALRPAQRDVIDRSIRRGHRQRHHRTLTPATRRKVP